MKEAQAKEVQVEVAQVGEVQVEGMDRCLLKCFIHINEIGVAFDI